MSFVATVAVSAAAGWVLGYCTGWSKGRDTRPPVRIPEQRRDVSHPSLTVAPFEPVDNVIQFPNPNAAPPAS